MDHDRDTMAFYHSDEASFETHDTIDALNTESLNRLILTALFDCFLSRFLRCLDVTAHAPCGNFGGRKFVVTDPSDDGCQGQLNPTLLPLRRQLISFRWPL
jgi:hypothetical protein